MKPIIYYVSFLLLMNSISWAQTKTSLSPAKEKKAEALVPPPVEQKFVIEHPDAKAKWKKDGEFYKALFVNPVNSLGQITIYDKKGRIVRKERELEQQEFPESIVEYEEKKFPGEGVAIWVSTDSTGNNMYYTQKNNVTFWFDRNGRPLSGNGRGIADDSLTGPAR